MSFQQRWPEGLHQCIGITNGQHSHQFGMNLCQFLHQSNNLVCPILFQTIFPKLQTLLLHHYRDESHHLLGLNGLQWQEVQAICFPCNCSLLWVVSHLQNKVNNRQQCKFFNYTIHNWRVLKTAMLWEKIVYLWRKRNRECRRRI